MELKDHISRWMEEKLQGSSFFLVDVLTSQGKGKLSVLIDGDTGIDIDTCASLSRQLSAYLDEHELITDKLVLELSSPGADQPLKLPRQYPKHKGRTLNVQLNNGDKLEGTLLTIEEETIHLQQVKGKGKKQEITVHTVPFNHIVDARVAISFK